jgi:hypothetical protein
MKPLIVRLWTIPLLVSALAARLGAEEADPKPSAQRFQQWIKELDDDRFSVREAATAQLAAAGREAVAALAAAADGDSPEVTHRVVGILRKLFLSSDPTTSAAAKSALVKLAASNNAAIAERAEKALRARQQQALAELERAGASFEITDGRVTLLNMNEVKEPRTVMALVQEFPDLESLYLNNPEVGDEELAHLKGLAKLQRLDLFKSRVGDEGLKLFKHLPSLNWVPMGKTRVTDAGLVHLKDLTQLEYVGLRANQVTDAGLVHLKNLTNLTGLHLGETRITDAGLIHLRRMTKLTSLRMWDTKVTQSGRDELRKSLPLVEIVVDRPENLR